MRKKFIRTLALSTVLAFGVGFLANQFQKPIELEATQHIANYDEYTYAGNYYSSIGDNLTEGLHGSLRKALSSLILPKGWYTYSGSSTGTLGKILQDSDQDPTISSNMVLFYSRDSISKRGSGGSTSDWNREHVWPQSLSNNHWGKEQAGADLLHIRPTWYTTNNTRGSIKYGDTNKTGPQTYSGMTYAYISDSKFEPIDAVKGDVARILMYVWTAYYEYYNDTSLRVTAAIESFDTLLKWHAMDRPDALEGGRNNFAESSKQKNRNPFVDHPEYAWKIFGEAASASATAACKQAYPDENETPEPPISSSSEPTTTESSNIPDTSVEPTTSISSDGETSVVPSPSSESEPSVEPEPSKKHGCFSTVGFVSLGSVTALVGLVFIFSKKKKK